MKKQILLRLNEIMKELRTIDLGIINDELIDKCFFVIKEHPDKIEQCRAAVFLANRINRDMAKRIREFLKENDKKLNSRVKQLLHGNMMRMAGF